MSKIKNFGGVKQLADELKSRGVYNKNFFIGIDGFLYAGKTCLANDLRNILGIDRINIIDIDNKKIKYYQRHKGSIVKYTNFNKLKEDIINIQKKTSIIFSSACLKQILEKIDISPDIYIYVKRMAKRIRLAPDEWRDKDDCTFEGDIKKWKNNKISKSLKFDSKVNIEDVKKSLMTKEEVVQYHQKYKPHKNADYYIRYEK